MAFDGLSLDQTKQMRKHDVLDGGRAYRQPSLPSRRVLRRVLFLDRLEEVFAVPLQFCRLDDAKSEALSLRGRFWGDIPAMEALMSDNALFL